jgi:hypothetical protein
MCQGWILMLISRFLSDAWSMWHAPCQNYYIWTISHETRIIWLFNYIVNSSVLIKRRRFIIYCIYSTKSCNVHDEKQLKISLFFLLCSIFLNLFLLYISQSNMFYIYINYFFVFLVLDVHGCIVLYPLYACSNCRVEMRLD